MRRDLLAPAAAAIAGALLLAWLGLRTMAFSDYEIEAEGALRALRAGDVAGFLDASPAYGGSLILRAPFALAPSLWGGGDLALYRSMALPGLLAGVVLALVLFQRVRARPHPPPAAWLVLGLAAVNPLTLRALEIGHPEELLGAVLCVGAALAAGARRPALCGALLGLAVANKPWAVVAIVPVALILDHDRRRALLIAAAVGGVVLAPFVIHGGGGLATTAAVARSAGQIFQPWQLFWFAGEHGAPVYGTFGENVGYRTPPAWIGPLTHPLVVLAGLALCLLAARRVRARPWPDGLLLLALVLLLRCLLDTWNTSYYALPFLLALLAWEVHARRAPGLLTLAATVLSWVSFELAPRHVAPDVTAALYLGWSVPLAAALALRLLSPERFAAVAAPLRARLARWLPTFVSRRPEAPWAAS